MLEVRGAREDEVDAAALCIGRAFYSEPGDVRDMADDFKLAMRRDTVYDLENTRVAVLDGQVVSVVQVADRRMWIDGVAVRQGFLTLVGTDPDHRGHGYGALLLWDAAEYMRQRGYSLSLVPGEGVEAFYERGGWRNFGHIHKLTVQIPDTPPAALPRDQIRPWHPSHDLDTILEIFKEYNPDPTGPAVRTREFWTELTAAWPHDYPMYYVTTHGGAPVAYLRHGWGRTIVEVGARSRHEDAILALIVHACREAQAAGQQEVDSLDMPPFRNRLEALGFTLRRQRVSGYLYRVVQLVQLLQTLLPRMQVRWTDSPHLEWSGDVLLDTEVGPACLRAHAGHLSISGTLATERPAIHVRVTHAQLIDLLFGQVELRHLAIHTAVPQKAATDILHTLFPNREFRWYTKDAI